MAANETFRGVKINTCTLAIAGLNLALSCDHTRLFDALCQRYHTFLSMGQAQFFINVSWKKALNASIFTIPEISFHHQTVQLTASECIGFGDIAKQRADLNIQVSTPLEAVDYFFRVMLALWVFQCAGVMVHGAGILHDGNGYLFFGHSGSGKTTVSRISENDLILNDDLVILMPHREAWKMYSTPFWHPTQIEPKPLEAPLVAMYRLVQDKSVFLEPIKPGHAVAEFLSSVPIIPVNLEQSEGVMTRCENLLRSIPIYRLHFLPDDSFWQVVTHN